MIQFLSEMSESVHFWRLMFLGMSLVAFLSYANPRIEVKNNRVLLRLHHCDSNPEMM